MLISPSTVVWTVGALWSGRQTDATQIGFGPSLAPNHAGAVIERHRACVSGGATGVWRTASA
jgi:hypothetical protein